jgi:hypothetical protein
VGGTIKKYLFAAFRHRWVVFLFIPHPGMRKTVLDGGYFFAEMAVLLL